MDAFNKVMEDLTWMLSSNEQKNGKDITVHGVHAATLIEISKMKTPEEIQSAMDMFMDAVLMGYRYVHEYVCYKLIRAIYRDLVSKGAIFPKKKLFEFNEKTVEDCVQDFPSRAALLFASGDDLEWTRNIEAVYWEDVMDETPTKELLMRCLKHHVDNSAYMLLW